VIGHHGPGRGCKESWCLRRQWTSVIVRALEHHYSMHLPSGQCTDETLSYARPFALSKGPRPHSSELKRLVAWLPNSLTTLFEPLSTSTCRSRRPLHSRPRTGTNPHPQPVRSTTVLHNHRGPGTSLHHAWSPLNWLCCAALGSHLCTGIAVQPIRVPLAYPTRSINSGLTSSHE